MDKTLFINIVFLVTTIIGVVCTAVSIYMFKTNSIPRFRKNDNFSVDEPRQAGLIFALFAILGFASAINLCFAIPSVVVRVPDFIITAFRAILFLSGLSLPILLIYAGAYGRRHKRVFGYINTLAARPHLKKHYKTISTLMFTAGASLSLASLTLALRNLVFHDALPILVPDVLFIIGVITCFAMSVIMLIMEHDIKRAVRAAKLAKRRKK